MTSRAKKRRTTTAAKAKASARAHARSGAKPAAPAPLPAAAPSRADPGKRPSAAPAEPQPPSRGFPVIGIGASAGGLEALELFLKHVPAKSGMAFVVIQHLDPTHKGAMVELLQRMCSMPVVQVKDRQKIEPDSVYVIPPNKDMSILHGRLHLLPQVLPRGLNLPIDFFFRSLAADQQERSIGVVLSGMGSDGTLGLRAIKEKAGAGFVQSLDSAKFDGMPRSVIEAGLADVIAPADELPNRIIAYLRHVPYITRPEVALEEKHRSALEKILTLLRSQTGNDFTLYKRSTVYRRIERRMGLHQIDKIANYVRYLRENPQEIELLFKELLIGVTSFFRDPAVWAHLKTQVLPELLTSRAQSGVLRAWVPGCSTGEEAYSLAIIFKEAYEQFKPARSLNLQIFATDLDKEAIEQARLGVYPTNIAADVSPERLRRFFVQDERGFRVSKEIRESVVFAPQNIIMDPPFTKLDLLSCRNLLIYLAPELQKKLIPLFHYSLNPGGFLFLGTSETVGAFSGLFQPVDGKSRLYRRLEATVSAPPIEFPAAFTAAAAGGLPAEAPDGAKAPLNLQTLAERIIVQNFAPTALITNHNGDILYISGRTGKYLEPAIGKANLNLFAMAREGLRYDLATAFAAALREERPVTRRGIRVPTDGHTQTVDLTVQKLTEPKELRGAVVVVFADVTAAPELLTPGRKRPGARQEKSELERDIQHLRDELQTTREEMQTSQEELKSTNEELQSTNEELQSTNEELTTSKEEMQSMNEELQTVNQELQSKVEELSRSNNDMKNLLNSTDIATLFLDGELLVRRFTTQTTKLIKLIPGDAGRPITDFAMELDYPELSDDAREVLRTLVFKERGAATRDGRWFVVRIMPYRTIENLIDGVVITFTDATASKQLEHTLRDQASQLRQMAESLPHLVWRGRPDGTCDYLSQQWVAYTGVAEAEQIGYGWLDRLHPEDRERCREEWKAAIAAGRPRDTELRIRASDGTFRWFKTRFAPIRAANGEVIQWYGTHTDIDDLKRTEERLASVLAGMSDAFVSLDEGLVIRCFNAAAEQALNRPGQKLLGRSFTDLFPTAAGALLLEKCQSALQAQVATSLRTPLGTGPEAIAYEVNIQPHPGGLSVLLRLASGEPKAVAR